MPTADGLAATPRAERYLVQLCRHAGKVSAHPLHGGHHQQGAGSPVIQHAEWTDTEGLLRLADGSCTLRATPNALLLHVDAADAQALDRIRRLLTARLEGFGRRDGLRVQWELSSGTSPSQDDPATPATDVTVRAPDVAADAATAGARRWRTPTAAAVLAVALAVAVHLGLLGGLLVAPHWAAGAVELVVAVIAVKVVVVVGLGLYRRRRRRAHASANRP